MNSLKQLQETLKFSLKEDASSRDPIDDVTAVAELLDALDKATDILDVPERDQDDEWQKKRDEILAIYDRYKHLRRDSSL